MTTKYSAKISYPLLISVLIAMIAPLILLINEKWNLGICITFLITILCIALILDVFLRTNYTITNNQLKIKSSIFPFKPIDIETIKEVSNTKSLISSPAPSFDRIIIKYNKYDEVIISPKDKIKFVEHLQSINPGIVLKIGGQE